MRTREPPIMIGQLMVESLSVCMGFFASTSKFPARKSDCPLSLANLCSLSLNLSCSRFTREEQVAKRIIKNNGHTTTNTITS